MNRFDLDQVLIDFANKTGNSSWTIRDSVEGVQIFGGIGSGKTSGSGRMIALKFLVAGYGGLVLTAKPDEKAMWQEYCELANRSQDLIIIEPGGNHFFNFLEYESSREGQRSFTDNIVQVLKTVIRASEDKSGGKSDDAFWETALDMLIFNVIDLCLIAYGKASIQEIYDIVLTAPKKSEEDNRNTQPKPGNNAFNKAFSNAKDKINGEINVWMKAQPRQKILEMDEAKLEAEILNVIPDATLLKFVDQFFMETYRNLGEKTRSIIEFSFSGFLFRLLKEPVYTLFCKTASTFTPEDSLQGKIILLNLPVKTFNKVGRDSQIMFKYIWQRAMEKRNININDRPVFLFADEAQNFLHEHDPEYQATARSSRIATVYISQNLPNYHANMGGGKSEYKVKAFLGTLATKVFHANADIETNRYASDLIGEAYLEDQSQTSTTSGEMSISKTRSYRLERMVRPEEFVALKTGGPVNNYRVEGYMHKQGRPFQDGLNFKNITFSQTLKPY